MLALEQTTYLGSATVLHAAGGRIKLELPDEHVWAISALAFPYQPVLGDEVLAVGQPGKWYVIGVIKGTGPTTLTAPGDLALAAPRGRITMTAAQGIELRADEVRVAASKLELLAKSVFERFTDATRWVKGVFQFRAGRVRTRVDGTYDLAAERIVERAKKDVKIDGEKIDLG